MFQQLVQGNKKLQSSSQIAKFLSSKNSPQKATVLQSTDAAASSLIRQAQAHQQVAQGKPVSCATNEERAPGCSDAVVHSRYYPQPQGACAQEEKQRDVQETLKRISNLSANMQPTQQQQPRGQQQQPPTWAEQPMQNINEITLSQTSFIKEASTIIASQGFESMNLSPINKQPQSSTLEGTQERREEQRRDAAPIPEQPPLEEQLQQFLQLFPDTSSEEDNNEGSERSKQPQPGGVVTELDLKQRQMQQKIDQLFMEGDKKQAITQKPKSSLASGLPSNPFECQNLFSQTQE